MNGPVAIILAAGQGKRMKSEKAKVLHEVCGQPMIRYVVDAARGAGARTIVVVVGYAADQVRDYLRDEPDVLFATQTEQLGTGHAAKVCRPLLGDYRGPGADPRRRRASAPARAAGRPAPPPAGRRRRLPARDGRPAGSDRLRPHPPRLRRPVPPDRRGARLQRPRNARSRRSTRAATSSSCPASGTPSTGSAPATPSSEYYLTDAPRILMAMGRKVLALNVLEPDDILGVNTRQHLAQANAHHAGPDPGPLDDRRA